MPRVLMFAPAFAPSYFSEGLVNSKLALAMLAAGWEVEVISQTSDHSMSYSAGWPQLWAPLKGLRRDVQPAAGGGSWRRFKSLSADVLRSGQWIQGVHWGPAASELALRLHREKPFDLVLSRSTSCSAHLPALLFCRKTGVQWIANWNDPPPHLFPPPYSYQVSKVRRLGMRRYFRAVAAEASFNTFPSQRLFRYLQAEFGIRDEQRVRVVPHIGLVDYEPRRRQTDGQLRFCHAGNLSEERNPALFLQALKNVVERHRGRTNIVCEIIGVESHGLAEQIQEMELAGIVQFSGAKSYEESLDVLANADVAVLIEAPCEEGIFMPSKVIDYAQLGKPVLAVSPAVGVMKDLLGDGRAGVHVDNRSVVAIEEGIDRLVTAWGQNRLAEFSPDRIWREGSPAAVLAAIEEMMGGIEARDSR